MILFIIVIIFLFFLGKENFSNAFSNRKSFKNNLQNLKEYLKKKECNDFIFINSHPDYYYTKDEILKIIQPIILDINNNLNENYILYQVNTVNKYVGNYYHLIFSVLNNHSVSMIETKLRVNHTSNIQIKTIDLTNSKIDNNNGYENSKLEYNTGIINEDYDWMFNLSKGNMGFPHGISNKTGY
jgi:hypothetical protein